MKKFLLFSFCSLSMLMSYARVTDNTSETARHGRFSSESKVDQAKIRALPSGDQKASFSGEKPLPNISSASLFNATRSDRSNYFYGYMVYSSVDYDLGIYKISPGNGYEMFLVDPYEILGFDMMPFNGWYVDGKVNGLSLFYYDPLSPMGYFNYSLDVTTGELEYEEYSKWYNFNLVFEICNLNPDDGKIYGYAANFNNLDWEYYWCWASPDDPTDVHVIRKALDKEHFISMCYRADQQLFYGITADFDFVSIDIEGNVNFIKSLPYYEKAAFYGLQSGLIWDYNDQLFYYNAQIYDFDYEFIYGFLYSITEDGDFEPVEQYSMDQQFSFFYSTQEYFQPNAPLIPEISEIIFEGASLKGEMKVDLPSTIGDGSKLPESISYTTLIDGKVYSSGNARSGESISVGFEVETSGEYTFGIYVTANGINSKTARIVQYVGYDIPMSPQNVTLSPYEISWDAVTQGIHGGFIDPDNISYTVYLNDEELGSVSGLSYSLELLKNSDLKKFTAAVAAVGNNMTSELNYSNTLVAGKPLNTPLNFTPTEEEFETMTVYNVDGDTYLYEGTEITWELSDYGLFSGGTEWNSYSMNDYIFLPPVNLKKDSAYSLNFDCGSYSDWFPKELLNVVCADNPCPQGVISLPLSDYVPKVYLKDNNWTEWDNVSVEFSVEEDGAYYIGFQCISLPQQYGIYIRNFELTSDDTAVDIVSIDPSLISSPAAGIIKVSGAKDQHILISSIDGRILVNKTVRNNEEFFETGSGLFVVKTDNSTVKVIVR